MTRQTSAPLTGYGMSASNRSARDLVNLTVDNGYLLIDTPYQRGSVWDLDQRIGLVRSWVSGVPIPALILNNRMTNVWRLANPDDDGSGPAYAVIDGKQRMETAIAWFGDGFAVPASWFPADGVERTEDTDDGLYVRFSGLSIVQQRFFGNRAFLPVAEASVATVADEADLYLLVNGAGTPQTGDDMARAQRVAEGSK